MSGRQGTARPDLILGHSRDDEAAARRIANALLLCGVSCRLEEVEALRSTGSRDRSVRLRAQVAGKTAEPNAAPSELELHEWRNAAGLLPALDALRTRVGRSYGDPRDRPEIRFALEQAPLLGDIAGQTRHLAGYVEGALAANQAAGSSRETSAARIALKWELDSDRLQRGLRSLVAALEPLLADSDWPPTRELAEAARHSADQLDAFSAYRDEPADRYRALGTTVEGVARLIAEWQELAAALLAAPASHA
jgi:hypothetical protein